MYSRCGVTTCPLEHSCVAVRLQIIFMSAEAVVFMDGVESGYDIQSTSIELCIVQRIGSGSKWSLRTRLSPLLS